MKFEAFFIFFDYFFKLNKGHFISSFSIDFRSFLRNLLFNWLFAYLNCLNTFILITLYTLIAFSLPFNAIIRHYFIMISSVHHFLLLNNLFAAIIFENWCFFCALCLSHLFALFNFGSIFGWFDRKLYWESASCNECVGGENWSTFGFWPVSSFINRKSLKYWAK